MYFHVAILDFFKLCCSVWVGISYPRTTASLLGKCVSQKPGKIEQRADILWPVRILMCRPVLGQQWL